MQIVILDFHTHILPPEVQRDRERFLRQDFAFATLYSSPRAKAVTAEQLIESMDQCGVERSVILSMGWTTQEMSTKTNYYLLEAAACYPKRLIPFCGVNPLAGEDALKEVERCARGGARGIGELHPNLQHYDLADVELMKPLMDMAKELDLIVLTHSSEPAGHSYAGKGDVVPEKLYQFLRAFPDVPVVCAHWGGGLPFYWLMPEVEGGLKKVFFDSAASPFLYKPQVFEAVVSLVGVEHLLFGSDYPLLSQEQVINQVRGSQLEEAEKALILGGNALRLLSREQP